jgi:hypothetical protein
MRKYIKATEGGAKIYNNFYIKPEAGGLDPDLVVYIDAGNAESYPGSGSVWYDLTDNENNGSLINTQYFSTEGGFMYLDGGSDYVRFNQVGNQFSQSENMTFEFWIFPGQFKNLGMIIWMDRPAFNNTYGTELFTLNSAGTFRARGSGVSTLDSSNQLNLVAWNHVVVAFDGTAATIYVNNVSTYGTGLQAISPSSYQGYIGKYPTITNTYDYDGRISVMRIYNRTLNASEVNTNYTEFYNRYF